MVHADGSRERGPYLILFWGIVFSCGPIYKHKSFGRIEESVTAKWVILLSIHKVNLAVLPIQVLQTVISFPYVVGLWIDPSTKLEMEST